MNSTTTTRRNATKAPIDPDAFHYVTKSDLAFSRQFGIEVRAICGFWFPCTRVPNDGSSGGSSICPRCKQFHAAMLEQRGAK